MDNNTQLFRWVKTSERLPKHKAEYFVIVDDYKSVSIFDGNNFYSNDNLLPATQWLEEYIPEVQDKTQFGKTPIQWWNNLSDFQKSCHLDNWQNPTNKDIEKQWCDVKDSLPKTVTSASVA